jgi:hypothetical protein
MFFSLQDNLKLYSYHVKCIVAVAPVAPLAVPSPALGRGAAQPTPHRSLVMVGFALVVAGGLEAL